MAKVIYVIGAVDGPQKIGIATRLKRRLSSLQTGNGFTLQIAGAAEVEDAEAGPVERYTHHMLRSKRLRGEWFDVTPEVAVSAVHEAVLKVRAGERAPSGYQAANPRGPHKEHSPTAGVTIALEKARTEAGISQRDLARALGISAPFLNDVLQGRRELGYKHFNKLPPEIRSPVIDAAQADLMDQADKLEQMR